MSFLTEHRARFGVEPICRALAELIPTGVHVVSLEDVERQGNLLIACPECGRDHEWKREDAVLAAS